MANLSDASWRPLLDRITKGQCTPFLGAGASAPILPLGGELSEILAKDFGYPLDDSADLASVSQWLAYTRDLPWAKDHVCKVITDCILTKGKPAFGNPGEIYSVLARLPLPMYLTTNYDTFMIDALHWAKENNHRASILPKSEYCRWHKDLRTEALPIVDPSVQEPLVFHMHGCLDAPSSLVLTEEDYEDFIVELTVNNNKLLPHRIMRAISDTALLFVGYGLRDWNFKVLFRAVVKSIDRNLRKKGVTVQLSKDDYSPDAQAYLQAKFEELKLDIYWGSCSEFAAELDRRWKAHPQPGGRPPAALSTVAATH